jgi:hypothetical protein
VNPSPRIFINYAREDEDQIKELYEYLNREGFSPWLDRIDLIGGEPWEAMIKRAARSADIFLACLSKVSVQKRGVIEDERREALLVRRTLPELDGSLIPVRLESCESPEELKGFQWIDWFDPAGRRQLTVALRHALQSRAQTPKKSTLSSHAIHIEFLRRGSSQSLLHLEDGKDFDLQNAQGLMRLIDDVERQLPRERSYISVFFCLLGDHLIARYDYYALGQLLEAAMKHRWGENRYIVLNRRVGFMGLAQQYHASLSQWFHHVFQSGATDLIEVRYEMQSPEANRLSRAMDRSVVRYNLLGDEPGESEWRCEVRESSWELGGFFRDYLAPKPPFRGNLVIVVEDGPAVVQTRHIRQALKKYPEARTWVAVRAMTSISSVDQCCRNNNLKLIECRGPFELRYLLLRLNSLGLKPVIS